LSTDFNKIFTIDFGHHTMLNTLPSGGATSEELILTVCPCLYHVT